MDFPLARAVAPLLQVAPSVASTNGELAARERLAPQPHGTALLTLDQTAGRGRLDRDWVAPSGSALAVSVVLASGLGPAALPWLPIIGGLAARDAVAAELAPSGGAAAPAVSMKWPNDVLVSGADGVERKIAGVLAEYVANSAAVVLGVGINTTMGLRDLPVPTATSILLAATDPSSDRVVDGAALADRVAATVLGGILSRVEALVAADGDAAAAGIQDEAVRRCGTLGRRVRVMTPGGGVLDGTARRIDASGAIVVVADDGAITAVHAGDVTHLRYE